MLTRTRPRLSAAATTLASAAPFLVSEASPEDREVIFAIRHEVYAGELGQHPTNGSGRLCDRLDDFNVYLVVHIKGEVAGFVSLTPPGSPSLSIDKYFDRESLPFLSDAGLYEVRLLTVLQAHRGREIATLLMYAAFRWVESHGGTRVVGIGRREVLDLYQRAGLEPCGRAVRSGAVDYELMQGTVSGFRERAEGHPELIDRLEAKSDWRLSFPFRRPAPCFHGGRSFEAIGEGFATLERRHEVINADVLDAWFPPSPKVLDAFREHLPWLLATSPPTDCGGLVSAIARARGVDRANILPGAGSSDLIFRALGHWLTPRSRALILDPTYGEYAHVLERVVGCRVDRLPLHRFDHYDVDLDRLGSAIGPDHDLVILVNPNSPTGRHVPRSDLEAFFRQRAQSRTLFWVDETYVDYAGPGQSLEGFAARSENVVVCKSMSKAYALSGARVGYLCAAPHQLEALRGITPPWAVSLPAQVAAVRALEDSAYYSARHAETAGLRDRLAGRLAGFGWEVVPGVANFLLYHLPEAGPDAPSLVEACRARGLFLRDSASMGGPLGLDAVRIAVKDASTIDRMVAILEAVLDGEFGRAGRIVC
jgi:histidinol-phosphate/aromatic aminotransferase/cobyric acid decarboxylase-like protein/GNAT superfamily N-acetyltransferase